MTGAVGTNRVQAELVVGRRWPGQAGRGLAVLGLALAVALTACSGSTRDAEPPTEGGRASTSASPATATGQDPGATSTPAVPSPSADEAAQALRAVTAGRVVSSEVRECLELRLGVDGAAVEGVNAAGEEGAAAEVSVVRACERVVRLAARLGQASLEVEECLRGVLAGVSEGDVRAFEAAVVNPSEGDAGASALGEAITACG